MANWPANGDTDWNTKMLAFVHAEHETDGTHGDITPTKLTLTGFFGFGTATELTISSGAVTATKSYHSIDTEDDDATDDLTSIAGGEQGDILILSPNSSSRTVVVKDGAGLRLADDFTMDGSTDVIMLIKAVGGVWTEVSRSNNA